MNNKNLPDNQSNFILYNRNDGKVNVNVFAGQIRIRNIENFYGGN